VGCHVALGGFLESDASGLCGDNLVTLSLALGDGVDAIGNHLSAVPRAGAGFVERERCQ
jgi:hypothetical protein